MRLKPQTLYWLKLLGLSLLGGVLVQLLTKAALNTTAVMYLGLPWLVAVLLAWTTHYDPEDPKPTVIRRIRSGLIVMMGSSLVLREGFICVVMFLPIYLFVMAVVALTSSINKPANKPIHLVPLLIALLALEGTHPNLSFERADSVTVARTTSLTKAELRTNLARPMDLSGTTSSGLSRLFPQPYQIDSASMENGAEHTVYYRYARWLWTNVHYGTLKLKIDEVSPDGVSARITHNSSYLSSYLDMKRLTLEFTTQKSGDTQVELTMNYRRTLDPAWYFKPLIRLALHGTGQHLLKEIVLKDEPEKQTRKENNHGA